MGKADIALQLTLALIEKDRVHVYGETNHEIGERVAEMYNAIINKIDYRADESRKS